ncbi:LANO_0H04434g1_1 [Lachancea nothofagi CBS 11611]|uniref:LANO_0H04434g1_1 n=1 Tax=Lachancea nothofagi CBS 11611 TaxID=1266666 RepID=A0A1G4KLD0_9SACH|nr:LANO_0H04434g1_1 [Lachancea nothofagi CBS 11611]
MQLPPNMDSPEYVSDADEISRDMKEKLRIENGGANGTTFSKGGPDAGFQSQTPRHSRFPAPGLNDRNHHGRFEHEHPQTEFERGYHRRGLHDQFEDRYRDRMCGGVHGGWRDAFRGWGRGNRGARRDTPHVVHHVHHHEHAANPFFDRFSGAPGFGGALLDRSFPFSDRERGPHCHGGRHGGRHGDRHGDRHGRRHDPGPYFPQHEQFGYPREFMNYPGPAPYDPRYARYDHPPYY